VDEQSQGAVLQNISGKIKVELMQWNVGRVFHVYDFTFKGMTGVFWVVTEIPNWYGLAPNFIE